ncbi:MAG: hypothetical protein AAFX94_16945 [Myxococcota bacterium]
MTRGVEPNPTVAQVNAGAALQRDRGPRALRGDRRGPRRRYPGNAMKDACGLTNPRQPTRDEVIALFESAYQG